MLADPITIAAASPTPELKFAIRSLSGMTATRIDTNGNPYSVVINHSDNKVGAKHYLQVLQTKDAVNPYTGLTEKVVASVSITINRPRFGFSDADMVALSKLASDIRDDSEVTTLRLLQYQS